MFCKQCSVFQLTVISRRGLVHLDASTLGTNMLKHGKKKTYLSSALAQAGALLNHMLCFTGAGTAEVNFLLNTSPTATAR